MNHPDLPPDEPGPDPDEVEQIIHEQDARHRRRDIEQTAIAALGRLRVRLAALLGEPFLDALDREPDPGKWWVNPATAELRVWWEIGGVAYYEQGGEVYVERERAGRLEWTALDGSGRPVEPWQLSAPPRGWALFN